MQSPTKRYIIHQYMATIGDPVAKNVYFRRFWGSWGISSLMCIIKGYIWRVGYV